MIDNKTLKNLEFDKILENVASFAVSERSKAAVLSEKPAESISEAVILQKFTNEAYLIKEKYNLSPIAAFDDVSAILSKAVIGATLNMGELLKIARLIRSARILKDNVLRTGDDVTELKSIVSPLFIDLELEKIISDSIASENEMRDGASDSLKTIRKKIKAADFKLKEKLGSYTRRSEVSSYLQDNLVTVRSGRFVIPVKAEYRSFVQGLIHDRSASGATVFIEPMAIVEFNNELANLRSEELHEIDRILGVLSQMTQNSAEKLGFCQEICTMSDIIFAKNAYSTQIKGVMPLINNKAYVKLIKARHPLIDKNKVVPVDLTFGKDFRILVITGPNTGGKTVCLKTTGLFCLMAYCGIRIPADESSEVAFFDNIFVDIGDSQSILSSLSTFSSHILNIVQITNELTNNSLILLDELGGGTDPEEGAALALGIIKYLELMKASGIITTHYPELKNYALTSKLLLNACMQFDEEKLTPTYKLIMGIPGASSALKIAKTLGLNDYIIKNSYESLSLDRIKIDTVLSEAETAKNSALREKEEYESIKNKLEDELLQITREREKIREKTEKINASANLEIKRIVALRTERAEELLEEMKELIKNADEKSLFEARQKFKTLENLKFDLENDATDYSEKTLLLRDVKEGVKVVIKALGVTGEIISLPNNRNEVMVQSGNAAMKLNINELALLENKPQKKSNRTNEKTKNISVKTDAQSLSPPKTIEIKVLGHTVSEAIELIEPYVISNTNNNVTLKIIHGKGSGALKNGLHNYFHKHSLVAKMRPGDYYEGGSGVTFLELK